MKTYPLNQGTVTELTSINVAFLTAFPPFYFVYYLGVIMSTLLPCRRYVNKSPEEQDEDLPGLEEDTTLELDLTVLRRRTMAAAAERRLQNLQDPAP